MEIRKQKRATGCSHGASLMDQAKAIGVRPETVSNPQTFACIASSCASP